MYYKDLEQVKQKFGITFIKIGWIDDQHNHTQGEVPMEFLNKLKKIKLELITFNWYNCSLCNKEEGSSRYIIPIDKHNYYDVPDLIIHYIEKHNYLPPREFIEHILKNY